MGVHFTRPVPISGDDPFYVATDFGLSEGNTAAQNKTALEAVVSTINAAGGGTIYISPGTYPLTGVSLSGASNIAFLGDTGGSVLDNSGQTTAIFIAPSCANISWEKLKFLGDFDTNTDAVGTTVGQRGVLTDNATDVTETRGLTFRDCIAENLCGEFVRFGPNTYDMTVTSCRMDGGLAFLEFRGVDDGAGDYRPCQHATVQSCKVQGALAAPNSYRSYGVTGSDDLIDMFGVVNDVVIAGNQFDANGDFAEETIVNSGVAVYGGVGGDPDLTVKGVEIANNSFSNFISTNATAQAAQNECSAINIFEQGETPITTTDEILITGNTFNSCRHALYHRKTINLTQFRGNAIRNCFAACFVNDSQGVSIEQNNIDGTFGSKAIYVAGSQIVVDGNTIRNSNYQHADSQNALHCDIYFTVGDDRFITNNKLYGNSNVDYGVRIVAGNDTVIRDNVLIDHNSYALSLRSASVVRARVGFNHFYGNTNDINDVGTDTRYDTLSGRLVQSTNLRGSETIADTANSAVVTFPNAEKSSAYKVYLSVSTNGAVTSGSKTANVVLSTYATTGFTIQLDAAPGAGTSVRVDWMLVQ